MRRAPKPRQGAPVSPRANRAVSGARPDNPSPYGTVGKLIAAGLLAGLAVLMLAGFLNSGRALSDPAALAALAIAVVLPAAGAALLARGHFAEKGRLARRKRELVRDTVDAEIMRLAGEKGGRLTAVEVSMALAVPPDQAAEALKELGIRGHAEVRVTDDGVLVYDFHDIRHLGGKSTARGVLDA